MEEPKSIKVLEVCKVAPNAGPSEFYLPLTYLDRVLLQSDPIIQLLFYEIPQQKYDSSVLVAGLKNSLSRTLQYYFLLAGQLTWPHDSDAPVIQYQSGDGVSLTVAETQANFNTLSGNSFRDSDVLRLLSPDFPTSKTQSPPITLQITLFPGSGFCVSYVAHHAVLDGKSLSMFLHSWAYICKFGDKASLPPELAPYLDRALVKQQQDEFERAYPQTFGKKVDVENRVLKMYNMSSEPDTMIGTFILTRENIYALKKSVLAYWGKKNKLERPTHVSSFVVSTAYAMVCLVKAKNIKVEKALIRIPVDARARMDLPLPSNYFGNCLVRCIGLESMNELLSPNGFFVAVEVIARAISSLREGIIKLSGKLKDLLPSTPKDVVAIVVSSSPQLKLYKVDLGWGKPKKVEMISIDKGYNVYFADDRDENGGIEIGVAVKKTETEAFSSVFKKEIYACKSLYSHL